MDWVSLKYLGGVRSRGAVLTVLQIPRQLEVAVRCVWRDGGGGGAA